MVALGYSNARTAQVPRKSTQWSARGVENIPPTPRHRFRAKRRHFRAPPKRAAFGLGNIRGITCERSPFSSTPLERAPRRNSDPHSGARASPHHSPGHAEGAPPQLWQTPEVHNGSSILAYRIARRKSGRRCGRALTRSQKSKKSRYTAGMGPPFTNGGK